MGCMLAVCAAQAACCCCSSACSLCCACCPSSVSSIMTRLMYLFMLIVGILLASVFLIPDVKEALSTKTGIPFYDKSICDAASLGSKCEDLMGFQSVYRVWFSFAMFFLFMLIITLGVKSSRDCRAMWHNGFWLFKFLMLAGIMVGAFFIPEKPFTDVWMYFGIVGGVFFIFFQVLYLIDFAHSWTESWVKLADDNKCWYIGFIFSSLTMYALAAAGIIGMYIYFTTSGECILNKFIISINLIFCIIASIAALIPAVQAANPSSGILQSSLVSLYVIYLTFSALSAEPIDSTKSVYCSKNLSNVKGAGNTMIIVGIVLAVLTIFYVSFKQNGDGGSVTPITDEESPVQKVADDEEDGTQYDYWFFHLLCLLGSLYFMMVMTNWFKPESVDDGLVFSPNWPNVWVQIIASWVCLGFYIWSLFAPIIFPDREFSWVHRD